MNRRMNSTFAIVAFILTLGVSRAIACHWTPGYFYQATNLKGKVVGSRFPVLHSFRWYRQSVVRPQAKLMLFDYCWPCDVWSLAPVKTVLTGPDGRFDFGILKPGHYYLRVHDEKGPLLDLFQVEVKGPPSPKEWEIIDISPVYPDCTGGHEFIVRAN